MRIPPKADPDVQRCFESVNQRIDQLYDDDIDLRNRRRVINSPRAKRDDDLCTIGEVKALLKDIKTTLERLKNVT